ncbi:transcription termination/antitermination protein NusA [bacterium (Candidatus Torokbacteria) CG_4_10_14_0_2_um_filter_35_8]|nr:MAG: transcription termination/antitermination protein NusA [bacterium (Candidatus Torokbacteria) CG_4_10_14_0_2_um_filter_35_8]
MKENTLSQVIEQICEERGISKKSVVGVIEQALAAAFKKDFGSKKENIKVVFELEQGKTQVFRIFEIVDEVEDKDDQTTLLDLKELKAKVFKFQPSSKEDEERIIKVKLKNLKRSDKVAIDVTPEKSYGRIAAQTAKQVVIQKIREIERDTLFNEYKKKEGQVINALVQKVEGENVVCDLGKCAGILPPAEQIRDEKYISGARLKVLVLEVNRTPKGPRIWVSRSHPELLRKLFELEVPEVYSGQVEIKAITREAGSRSKIAVVSKDEGVDPIGACVGQRGARIQTIVNELSGEKIDIIIYSDDPKRFVASALAPAKVAETKLNEKERIATCFVLENSLSLAIGKRGQNVRLAAKLTGWKIDIKKVEVKKEKSKKGVDKKEKQPKDTKKGKTKKREKKSNDSSRSKEKDKKEKRLKKEKKRKK